MQTLPGDRQLKFFGVMDEDPFGYDTWSGSSRYFFTALKLRGCLAGATGTNPRALESVMLKAKNFQPSIQSWRFNYHLDTAGFARRTFKALQALRSCQEEATCVLQVGAWYDLTGHGLPVVSYHDGNLARRLDSPYGYPPVARHRVRAALEYERGLYQRIDLIFPMSQWLASSFVEDFGVPEDKVIPVYAGINMPDQEQLIPATYDSRHILFVGKDFRRKGGPDLLAAFSLLRKNMKDVRLTIVGPNIKLDMPGVRTLGTISKASEDGLAHLCELYRSAAVFAMPTLYEPFGIAFAEAMAHGLPCVGTRICAVPEIVEDMESGLLVGANDTQALARALFEVLRDPNMCEKMGAAGFDRYRANFRWDAVAEKVTRYSTERVTK